MSDWNYGYLNARISPSQPADTVMSADGLVLYVADPDGKVRVYDVATRTLQATWDVGVKLGGMDISPSGDFLMVVEREPLATTPGNTPPHDQTTTVTVYKIDVETGAKTSFPITMTGSGGVFFDLAVGADGNAILGQSFRGVTGSGPLIWRLDVETGQYTNLNERYATEDVTIWRNGDGSEILIGPSNSSAAPLYVYEPGTGFTDRHDNYQDGVIGTTLAMSAISSAAGLVAQAAGKLYIYDTDLDYQFELSATLTQFAGAGIIGLAFDGTGANLYILDQRTDTISQVSTTTWTVVRSFAVGAQVDDPSEIDIFSQPSPDGDYGNQLLVTPDGRYFTVVTGDGLRIIENDSLANNFTGTDAVDDLDAGAGNDQLFGLAGNDVLRGGDGDDTVSGGAGDDILYGGIGADNLQGDDGDDQFVFSSVMTTNQALPVGRIDGGTGIDTIDLRFVAPAGVIGLSGELGIRVGSQQFTVANVERILFGHADDLLFLPDSSEAIELRAGSGADVVHARGAWSVYGEGGDDSFFVSGTFGAGTEGLIDGGDGADLLRTNISFTVDLADGTASAFSAVYAIFGIENVQASTSGYSSTVRGDAGANRLTVSSLNDDGRAGVTFDGRGGADILIGSAGADSLLGGEGDDDIAGGLDADTLTGGMGNDLLDGGAGFDTAVFAGAASSYSIVNLGGGRVRVSGPDGVDSLTAIERLQFDDGLLPVPPNLLDQSPSLVLNAFGAGAGAGGWLNATLYPRTAADVNGDGRADIVGFGDDRVLVSLANDDSSFDAPFSGIDFFGASLAGGGWTNANLYPRTAADVNGDGRADLIGFGDDGVFVSLADADGTFAAPSVALAFFGASASGGGWTNANLYPRTAADVNGDGRADLVGFGDDGVFVSLANLDGTFATPSNALAFFGASVAGGGWLNADRYPRTAADVNGDGLADLIGFGDDGVFVALATGGGSFGAASMVASTFGASAAGGGWTSNGLYPRMAADVNGDGNADLIGFGEGGVYIAAALGDGTFVPAVRDLVTFGAGTRAGGWTSNDLYPRRFADVNSDGRADILAFGDGGVFVAEAVGPPSVIASSLGRAPDAPFAAPARGAFDDAQMPQLSEGPPLIGALDANADIMPTHIMIA